MTEQFFNFVRKHLYSGKGLVAGYLLVGAAIVGGIDDFLENGIKNFLVRLIIYGCLGILWQLTWLFLRSHVPKNKKHKIGITIAIITENDKQKIRIKCDFSDGIQQLLKTKKLLPSFNVQVLQDYKATKVYEILQTYCDRRKEYIERGEFKKFGSSRESRSAEKLIKKNRGSFFIWGSIKSRLDGEPTYLIALEALVIHKPIELEASSRIARDFSAIFPRKISIREKQELAGFELTASVISIAIRYMTGIAALVSFEMLAAYDLHRSLMYDIEKYPLSPPAVDFLRKRLKEAMYSETVVLARYHYDKERDLTKFSQYLKEAEHINENGYEVLVLNSVRAFVDERDPLKALQYLKRARKVNDGEFTWLYNKAFIYMYLGKFELGYKDYRKLKDITFPGDEAIIDQCLEFNKALIAKEPDKTQCHFILGYLYMNKKCNLPLALEEFDLFMKNAKGKKPYDYLLERAATHKRDIEIKMGL